MAEDERVRANREYIRRRIAERRGTIRYRYSHGDQPGTQSTATPLRFIGDDERNLLVIEHATRTPRQLRLDRLETLSEDEPRPEPFRVGDPAEIARGENFRRQRAEHQRRRRLNVDDEQLDAEFRYIPDRR